MRWNTQTCTGFTVANREFRPKCNRTDTRHERWVDFLVLHDSTTYIYFVIQRVGKCWNTTALVTLDLLNDKVGSQRLVVLSSTPIHGTSSVFPHKPRYKQHESLQLKGKGATLRLQLLQDAASCKNTVYYAMYDHYRTTHVHGSSNDLQICLSNLMPAC